ncbi:hypothetical protein ACQJBY_028115 [Aegilops geniculata]
MSLARLARPRLSGEGLASSGRRALSIVYGDDIARSIRADVLLPRSARAGGLLVRSHHGLANHGGGNPRGLSSSAARAGGLLVRSHHGLANHGGGNPRGLSTSAYMKEVKLLMAKCKPSDGTMVLFSLVVGVLTIVGSGHLGYKFLEDRVVARAKAHVDTVMNGEKEERQRFQNVATGAHHDFVSNESTAQMQRDIAGIRSAMLDLERKEFEHHQVVVEIVKRHVDGV